MEFLERNSMELIYSKINKDKLLHIVNRIDEISGRTDVIPQEHFIQLATLKMKMGTNFRPHKHIWKKASNEQIIAQESWVVIHGKVEVSLYDIDNTLIKVVVIGPGDASITLEGGHTYKILEEDTIVYEYKTGPYTGIENDKVFIDE